VHFVAVVTDNDISLLGKKQQMTNANVEKSKKKKSTKKTNHTLKLTITKKMK